ncbi:MAG: ABC transporter substrate-binding protein [Planctomycetota bacterium]
MNERSIVTDIIKVVLMAMMLLVGIIVLLQNQSIEKRIIGLESRVNETQNRVEQIQSTGLVVSGPTGNASSGSAQGTTETYQGFPVYIGEDGVKETVIAGIRVRTEDYRNPEAVNGDNFIQTYVADPPSLNPYTENESTASSIFGMCNDSFVTRDVREPTRYIPMLAEWWEIDQDIRYFIKDGENAEALVEMIKKAAKKPLPWPEYDIIAIESTDGNIIHIRTNSAAIKYQTLTEPIIKGKTRPVFYISATINPAYRGDDAPDALKVVNAIQTTVAPAWELIDCRVQTDNMSMVFAVLSGEKALEAAVNKLLEPNNNEDASTNRGSVDMIDERESRVTASVTFHLRRGVKWQSVADPRPERKGEVFPAVELTAHDVKFTWDKFITVQKVPCGPQRSYLGDTLGVEVIDDYTVRIDWNRPYFMMFDFSNISILPRHVFDYENVDEMIKSPLNQIIVGNGRWKLTEWTRNSMFVLERNENYWGRNSYLDKYVMRCVPDPTAMLELFKKGETDSVSLTSEQWKMETADSAFMSKSKTDDSVANVYRYIGYNARLDKFKDRRAREAMTRLINRRKIVRDIFNNTVIQLNGPFHIESPYFNKSVRDFDFDPAVAARLLAELGWKDTDGDGIIDRDGQPFEFELSYPGGSPEYGQIATLFQNDAKQAGVKVNLLMMEWTAYLDKINKLQFEACMLGWSLGSGEGDPFQLWHSSQTGQNQSNHCAFINKEADDIIIKARYVLDPDARYAMYRRLHEIITHEQPYTFLFIPRRKYAYSKRFEDYRFFLVGSTFDDIFVKKENQLQR